MNKASNGNANGFALPVKYAPPNNASAPNGLKWENGLISVLKLVAVLSAATTTTIRSRVALLGLNFEIDIVRCLHVRN